MTKPMSLTGFARRVEYIKAHRKGVGAEIEKSRNFKKYEVEEIDVQTLESKGKK